ncbi:13135_t:CDS:2 [Acaulospora morrowiae]|uniref:13135_t:CDS:1 n=1 Tax=Acaulospora morrowiae TaxID=94023 RepID=A0A9N9H6K2_9GLOM|nr:13135_t:CDS:2 [Acaulospora morrowiae]
MGKKNQKGGKSEPGQVQHREIYQRMNFLYQAATLMTSINIPNSHHSKQKHNNDSNSTFANQSQDASSSLSTHNHSLVPLGRFYVNTMKTIGTKQVLRIDPSIKRTLCRRCETLLLPGVTSRVRIKSSSEKNLQIKCTQCNVTRKIPTRKGYVLFSEKRENIFGMETDEGNVENNVVRELKRDKIKHHK